MTPTQGLGKGVTRASGGLGKFKSVIAVIYEKVVSFVLKIKQTEVFKIGR